MYSNYHQLPKPNCPVCNYDEVFFDKNLMSYTCGSHHCFVVLKTKLSVSIQPRCGNPECKQPHTASGRYPYHYYCNNGYGVPAYYACNECNAMYHGPEEHPNICRDCGQDIRGCSCSEKVEFLYGGPLVVCERCCKQSVWLGSSSGTGFAGGQIYLDRFSCGHDVLDESNDILAAY